MTVLIVNGPNLNLLGQRDKKHYGAKTFKEIKRELLNYAKNLKIELIFFQSNCEGKLIDFIQKNSKKADGILINPGALTHYGYSLRDALVDAGLPVVEVHLSGIQNREDFRKINVFSDVVIKRISGFKEKSYLFGLRTLINYLKKNK